jgi:hypothetical protein
VVDGVVRYIVATVAMGTLTTHTVDTRALSVVVVLAWVGVGWSERVVVKSQADGTLRLPGAESQDAGETREGLL